MANENKKELPMWKRIKRGDKLPCQSFLRKYDGEILRLTTTGGVTVGQDCFYLPVENVIEEIRKYPIEESEDEKVRRELLLDIPKVFPHDKAFRYIAYLEKQGEKKPILDVEIPFGAKDSELEEVTYDIPKGYHAEIEDNKVVIKKGEQKSAEWSKEDEFHFKSIESTIEYCKNEVAENDEAKNLCNEDLNWFKSLKDRVQPQRKQEWSEEDKNALKVVTDVFEQYGVHLLNYPAFVHWIKTLPERISFNTYWKPSEEQLDALNNMRFAVQHFGPSASLAALDDLYNQLKKLTE